MTDFRSLCAELLEWAEQASVWYFVHPDVILRARAALAEQPVVPTDEELMDLAEEAWVPFAKSQPHPQGHPWDLVLARAVLARWGTPAIHPVPVAQPVQVARLEQVARLVSAVRPVPVAHLV
jgi:hypothetical protein